MKVMTILGTRPEIIRLSLVIRALDQSCDHILVHTGQNYTDSLSKQFFDDLEVRDPDHYMGIRADSFGEQIGEIIAGTEKLMISEAPDRLLILGDTNSGLSAITSKRLGIPVYHLEAGNRCYDDRVPEEINRRIIDHSSDVLMPYTHRSKENLVREGIQRERIFVIGNPIFEVLKHYESSINESTILVDLDIEPRNYFLVTMHRAENVDEINRLRELALALEKLTDLYKMPIICSLHPRTKSKMEAFGLSFSGGTVQYLEPLGFFDFVALEQQARCVLSDSGTVQEECAIFQTPNVTLRDVTERPETIEVGSNILSGTDCDRILATVKLVLGIDPNWKPPQEYLTENTSNTILKIVLGYRNH